MGIQRVGRTPSTRSRRSEMTLMPFSIRSKCARSPRVAVCPLLAKAREFLGFLLRLVGMARTIVTRRLAQFPGWKLDPGLCMLVERQNACSWKERYVLGPDRRAQGALRSKLPARPVVDGPTGRVPGFFRFHRLFHMGRLARRPLSLRPLPL